MANRDNNNPFVPEKIAATDSLEDLSLSFDATKVLYHVKPCYRTGNNSTCALWIAEVDKANSAKQLTAGLFNDYFGRFHPDGQRILFLSDRHKAGGSTQIYSIRLDGGEACPLFGKVNKRSVGSFEISPNGKHIAFTSEDEPTEETERKEKEKDDAKVFGDKTGFAHLRLYTFATGVVRTLNVPTNRNVSFYTWKPDSSELYFITTRQAEVEFVAEEVALERIPIAEGEFVATTIGVYPSLPSSTLAIDDETIVNIQSFEPDRIVDSKAVFVRSLDSLSIKDRSYGESEDAGSIANLHHNGLFAVEVYNGVDSRIDVMDVTGASLFTLFQTSDEGLSYWTSRCRADGTFVFAALVSSAVRQQPVNVWSGTVVSREQCKLTTKLSSHMQWLDGAPAMKSEVFRWKAKDGLDVDGIVTYPPSYIEGKSKPMPTVVQIHGGPYWRDTLHYSPWFYDWRFLLASHGYLVISPNYRGGQGHGASFARFAHGGMETLWVDCEAMLDAMIERKLADSTRVGLGGYSGGGFLSALGAATTKNRFKAAVVGGGISDWGILAATTDIPDVLDKFAGATPWTPDANALETCARASPIRHVEAVETATLILHGQEDARVPPSQAIALHRGLRRHAKYPERAQLVLYPREPHAFVERSHVEDFLKRVLAHYDLWL